MSVTVSIPTPLRSFTGGRDAVERRRRHRGPGARRAPRRAHRPQAPPRPGRRAPAHLRQPVSQRHRHPPARLHRHAGPPRATCSRSCRASRAAVPATETELPKLSHAEVLRYSRHLLLPEVGVEGQRKLKAARVLTIGAGGLGSPLSLYLAAAGVGTIGIVDFDVVDLTNLQRQIVHGTSTLGRPEARVGQGAADRSQPQRQRDREARDSAHVRERARHPPGLRHRRRRDRQLPHPLPGERRLRAAGEAQRLRQHLPVRGPGLAVLRQGRALLPLPLLRAAASGPGAELRRGRRARRAAGHHRQHPGARDHQVDHRGGGLADRAAGAVRRAQAALPRAQAAQGPELPDLRRPTRRSTS